MVNMTTADAAVIEDRWVPEVDIATRLRLVRREYGRLVGRAITQADMAELLDVPKNRLQQWEAGNSVPRDLVAVAKRMAEVTGVDVTWILGVGPADTQVTFSPRIKTGSRCNVDGPDGGWIPDPGGCGMPALSDDEDDASFFAREVGETGVAHEGFAQRSRKVVDTYTSTRDAAVAQLKAA